MAATGPLALTIGEPAGIAGEITLKAWAAAQTDKSIPPFVSLADPGWLEAEGRQRRFPAPVKAVKSAEQALAEFYGALPVLRIGLSAPVELGKPNAANAPSVLRSIDEAVRLTSRGAASAVVTNPIHKATMYAGGFKFPGHTEYLAELSKPATPVMMLAIDGLRVVLTTVHLSLAKAVASLTSSAVETVARVAHSALIRDFGIASPRLAVAALNPHAGEDGALGTEERDIIAPAIATLRKEGIDALGPFPADTLFHTRARERYDAAICMYHDQALIPLKTLDFNGGVNVTLGLPFVRTSPDHGTALDIAGHGKADPTSLIAALRLAASMAAKRAQG
ncbi:MAG: 4-hydroxythreonine-4-phosphate dehydrogenase PdxA [Alphaproteobacteria bacterium]|nr:4-hydroxythreonine-4-phosphate dehydrogenase PdxA [Alphaproteobacteria bacterium]